MNKIKLAVIFGGMSTEHDVSIASGTAIIRNLDKEKYAISPIYIDKDGKWYEYLKKVDEIENLKVGGQIEEKKIIENITEYLKNMDCIFPVLHGLFGEDGTIQGLFELLNIPYVGCKVLASSIAMDKVYSKIVFEKAGLKQAPYIYIRKNKENYLYIKSNFEEEVHTTNEIAEIAQKKLKYPMFIKPSNSGSSVGISKACNKNELQDAIEYASKFDRKILIEQGIEGREVECAVLGNENVITGSVGEVLSAEEFYSFNSKYKNNASKTQIPAKISNALSNKIKKQAIKAFKAIDGAGLARVDFFIENDTNEIMINEINTMPGFTNISMYPKLFEDVGIKYSDLLDKIIELAI